MFKRIVISFALAALGATAYAIDPQGDVAQEVKAEWLTLGVEIPGTLLVKTCSSCSTYEFDTTAATSFEIGGVHVNVQEMRRVLADQPRLLLLLQLTPDRKQVARIVVSAPAS